LTVIITMIVRRLLSLLLITGLVLAQDTRSRIRRPVLRVRPDRGGEVESDNDSDNEKQARQLSRERSRIRRPSRRKPVEGSRGSSFDSLDDSAVLSRFLGPGHRRRKKSWQSKKGRVLCRLVVA